MSMHVFLQLWIQKSIICDMYTSISFRVTSATLAKTDTKVLSLSISRAATALIPSPIHIHAAYQRKDIKKGNAAMSGSERIFLNDFVHKLFHGSFFLGIHLASWAESQRDRVPCQHRLQGQDCCNIIWRDTSDSRPWFLKQRVRNCGAWLIPKFAGTMTHLGCLEPCNDTIGGNDMGTIPFILLSMLTHAHTRPAQTRAHTRRKKSETQRFEQINFSVLVYRHTLTIWGLSQDSREQIDPSSWKLRLREGGNPRDPHYQHHQHHHDTDGAVLHSSWALWRMAPGPKTVAPRKQMQGLKHVV